MKSIKYIKKGIVMMVLALGLFSVATPHADAGTLTIHFVNSVTGEPVRVRGRGMAFVCPQMVGCNPARYMANGTSVAIAVGNIVMGPNMAYADIQGTTIGGIPVAGSNQVSGFLNQQNAWIAIPLQVGFNGGAGGVAGPGQP